MTNEEASIIIGNIPINGDECYSIPEYQQAKAMAIKALEQQPCEDAISRQALKRKLQEHHDFFINAYGGFSNMSQNDKSRVDEIINCIAMVVNEPPVTPKEKTAEWYGEDGCKGACEGYMSAGVICSQCGEVFCGYIGDYDFCPNCGARMVSE